MSRFSLALLIIVVSAALLYAEELQDTTRTDSLSTPTNSSFTAEQFKLALDSLYVEIGKSYSAVEPVLKKSCFDCHSDQTIYPWYHKLPIAKQLINTDIQQARENLDLSEGFPFGGKVSQEDQLREIREEIEYLGMPPLSYRFMHWGRAIEGEQQDSLFLWIDSSLSAIERVRKVYNVPDP